MKNKFIILIVFFFVYRITPGDLVGTNLYSSYGTGIIGGIVAGGFYSVLSQKMFGFNFGDGVFWGTAGASAGLLYDLYISRKYQNDLLSQLNKKIDDLKGEIKNKKKEIQLGIKILELKLKKENLVKQYNQVQDASLNKTIASLLQLIPGDHLSKMKDTLKNEPLKQYLQKENKYKITFSGSHQNPYSNLKWQPGSCKSTFPSLPSLYSIVLPPIIFGISLGIFPALLLHRIFFSVSILFSCGWSVYKNNNYYRNAQSWCNKKIEFLNNKLTSTHLQNRTSFILKELENSVNYYEWECNYFSNLKDDIETLKRELKKIL